jgi:hypothetical protein
VFDCPYGLTQQAWKACVTFSDELFSGFFFILFSVCFVFRQRAALGVVPA